MIDRRIGGIKRVPIYVLACYGCGKWVDFSGEGGWTASETRQGIQEWIDGSGMTLPWEKTCSAACSEVALKRHREREETAAQQRRRDRRIMRKYAPARKPGGANG